MKTALIAVILLCSLIPVEAGPCRRRASRNIIRIGESGADIRMGKSGASRGMSLEAAKERMRKQREKSMSAIKLRHHKAFHAKKEKKK